MLNRMIEVGGKFIELNSVIDNITSEVDKFYYMKIHFPLSPHSTRGPICAMGADSLQHSIKATRQYQEKRKLLRLITPPTMEENGRLA